MSSSASAPPGGNGVAFGLSDVGLAAEEDEVPNPEDAPPPPPKPDPKPEGAPPPNGVEGAPADAPNPLDVDPPPPPSFMSSSPPAAAPKPPLDADSAVPNPVVED